MWQYFFHWWQGSVWGNLIASLVWAIPAFLYGRFHVKKVHKRLDLQDDKMDKIHQAVINQGDSNGI